MITHTDPDRWIYITERNPGESGVYQVSCARINSKSVTFTYPYVCDAWFRDGDWSEYDVYAWRIRPMQPAPLPGCVL